MSRTSFAAVVVLAAVCATVIEAQGELPVAERFQVASVKRNATGESSLRFEAQPGGRFVAVNIPLKQLIRAAYTLQLYQILNAPDWVDSERFDIVAVAERDITPTAPWTPGRFAPIQLMIQSLLADRFRMAAHHEMRPSQAFLLVVDTPARSAEFMKPSTAEKGKMQIAAGTLTATNLPLAQFAEFLSQVTGRVVTDATGLTGGFDLSLRWNPDLQQNATDAPSIFTAVQEQLGLKLTRSETLVDHLVIDSIARPDAD